MSSSLTEGSTLKYTYDYTPTGAKLVYDGEADRLLAVGSKEALEIVARYAYCGSGRHGSSWCRACEARERLARIV